MAIITIAVVAAAFLPLVYGGPANRDKIPNGYNVMRGGSVWDGVGHCSAAGGGQCLNPFGQAFKAAGYTWTTALCEADSDGDGQSNGFELGDPECTWVESGAAPSRSTDISHPGFSDSMTSAANPDGLHGMDNTTDMNDGMDGGMGDGMNDTGASTTVPSESLTDSDDARVLKLSALAALMVSAAFSM
mmetsp:Transcript_23313/g.42875  ORF Transcript_23313/g.42875 Transcript_23313/m.42875 type:complete len:188 (-) Transcript_23313:183-746(-)